MHYHFVTILTLFLFGCGGDGDSGKGRESNEQESLALSVAVSKNFSDQASYFKPKYIKMSVQKPGRLIINVQKNSLDADLDCSLMVNAPDTGEDYEFVYDDLGIEQYDYRYNSDCQLDALFLEPREFYFVIELVDDIGSSVQYSGSYTFDPIFKEDEEYTVSTSTGGGSFRGLADFDNSDFIKFNMVGAGIFNIEIEPNNRILDIDCGLTTNVGPSVFSLNDFIFDDVGYPISNNSNEPTCNLTAYFFDDREFYLFVDVADGPVISGWYNVSYTYYPFQ